MAESFTPEQKDQIEAEIFAGRKIQAIKLVREATGVGLKEAKDIVEARTKQLRESSPDRFAASAGNSGCAGVIVLGLAILAPLLFWILRTT